MVMNIVAICLVATSLAAAGVWSPAPATEKHNDVIVKEGLRVVVVEYDQDGHRNTKVSISPDHDHHHLVSSTAAKEKAEEAAAEVGRQGSVAKELICDAYGKCKHVISSTLGRAKDKASDRVYDVERKAEDAKERATGKFDDIREGVEEVKESVARRAKDTIDDAKDTAEGVQETLYQKAQDLKEGAEDTVHKAKEEVKTKTKEAAQKAKETTEDKAKATGHWFKDMGKKVVESQMMADSVPGLMNLLGFATAYGMCMWVTFISSYVLAGSLPRQQFAVVQSKIYPVYFRAMAYSIGTALLGFSLSQRKRLFENKAEMLQGFNLASSLLMVFLNMLYLEPRATKVMFDRMRLEKEEGRGRDLFGGGDISRNEAQPLTGAVTVPTGIATTEVAPPDAAAPTRTTRDKAEEDVLKARVTRLNNRLKSLNSYSSLVNILTLMGLTWHLLYQNQRLSAAQPVPPC